MSQDTLYEITGKINGPITLGHVDILIRYLKKCAGSEDEEARAMFNRLKKVDSEIWSMAVGHPDFPKILDAIIVRAGLGIITFSKEQREWFKILQGRAGHTFNVNKPGAAKQHNLVISVKPLPGDEGVSAHIDPRDGTLPDYMKKGVPGLDPDMETPQ